MGSPLVTTLSTITLGNARILVLHTQGIINPGNEILNEVCAMNHQLKTAMDAQTYHGVVMNLLGLKYLWGDALSAMWGVNLDRHGIPVVFIAVGKNRRVLESMTAYQKDLSTVSFADGLEDALSKIVLLVDKLPEVQSPTKTMNGVSIPHEPQRSPTGK